MWELNDCGVKDKIASYARSPEVVAWSRSAERDIGSTAGATKFGVLEAVLDHLSCGYVVYADHMTNGDEAFIVRCFLGRNRFYVKVKFIVLGSQERMYVFSAHRDR